MYLRILKSEDNPGLCSRAQCNRRGYIRPEEKRRKERIEAEVQTVRLPAKEGP
jgi:hypothetical protein